MTKKKGRPSSFKPEYVAIVREMCILGATDKDLARALGVTEQTINNWKTSQPAFFESLKSAKDEADDAVERSLYERATGYSHPAVKILTVSDGGNAGSHVEEVPYTEHFPPDTTACIFWLKNRRKDKWRDKSELGVTGEITLAQILASSRKIELTPDSTAGNNGNRVAAHLNGSKNGHG